MTRSDDIRRGLASRCFSVVKNPAASHADKVAATLALQCGWYDAPLLDLADAIANGSLDAARMIDWLVRERDELNQDIAELVKAVTLAQRRAVLAEAQVAAQAPTVEALS